MPMLGESPGYTTGPTLVDLNAVGDTFVPVPFGYFIPRRMTAYGASTSMSGSSCTLGAYTASAAGGTAIVTPATGNVTPLTAVTKFKDATIAATTDYLSPTSYTQSNGQVAYGIFIRVGVAHGSAATCYVQFELEAVGVGA